MKFRNTIGNGYAFRMNPAVPRTVLARLRASTRLAVLVLLIFALKIGAAAACAKSTSAGEPGEGHTNWSVELYAHLGRGRRVLV